MDHHLHQHLARAQYDERRRATELENRRRLSLELRAEPTGSLGRRRRPRAD